MNSENKNNQPHNDDALDQQLLELHYGLLDDAEAQDLRARIETESSVAMRWAKTLELAGQFASAANLAGVPDVDTAKVTAPQPNEPANRIAEPADRTEPANRITPIATDSKHETQTASNVQLDLNGRSVSIPPMKPVKAKSTEEATFEQFTKQRKRHWRWVMIASGLAACFLVIIFGRFFNGIPASPAMALRIEASSATSLTTKTEMEQSENPLRNQFEFFTSRMSSTSIANGVSASLLVTVKAGKAVLHHATLKTDATGKASYLVPPNLKLPQNATLHVTSSNRKTNLVIPLEPTRCLTYLNVDKPVYRPGETLRFRSLTLERFSLRPDVDLPIRFEMLDPSGAVVTGAFTDGITDRGVGNGEFLIPTSAPGGEYTLVAKSLDGFFPNETRKIQVRNYRVPRFKKDIEFERRSYGAGDTVKADFEAIRAEGGPLVEQSVNVTAKVDGEIVFEKKTQTDASGTCTVSFNLPEHISKGSGQVSFAIDDGGTQEVQSKTIPIQLGKVVVDFYPEGGYLVDGLVNRVYFAARNSLGKPIHIAGEVLDRSGNQVTKLKTTRDGMGRFEFTPKLGQRYSLKVSSPIDVNNNPHLPKVVERLPVLATGSGVFGNDDELKFSVQTQQEQNILVQAVCRGELVASQAVAMKPGETAMAISLPPEVEGVIRLTILDADSLPHRPLVERLVYRESRRKLTVKVDESVESLQRSPGEQVRLSLSVFDENGKPAPAVLGIRVVDDAALSLEEDEMPVMPTHFMLTSEIEKPEDLEHANFYLSGSDESRESLDLLLGTQGWRRFVGVNQADLAAIKKSGKLSESGFSEQLARLIELDGATDHSVSLSNVKAVNEDWTSYSFAVSQNWSRFMSDLRWLILGFAIVLALIYIMRPKFRMSHSAAMLMLLACGYAMVLGCGNSYTTQKETNAPSLAMDSLADGDAGVPSADPKSEIANNEPDFEHAARTRAQANFRITGDSKSKILKRKIQLEESNRRIVDGNMGAPGPGEGMAPLFTPTDEAHSMGNASDSRLVRILRARGLDPNSLSDQLLDELRFPVREYAHQHLSTRDDMREDFAETLYWQPLLITDSNGKASIRFDLSDSVTTFKVMADAHSSEGRIGTGGGDVVSRLPLQVEPKMPLAVTTGDRIDLPVAVVNATNSDLPVDLKINPDSSFKLVGESSIQWSLTKQQRTRGHFGLEVQRGKNETDAVIELTGTSDSLTDSIKKTVHVSPAGFPIRNSVSGVLNEKVSVMLPIPKDAVSGSVSVSLKAYPSPLADLASGVESILREPHGCFEQTSATNYPNTMALLYLQQNQLANPKTTRRAKTLLNKGYKKLISFECDKLGYDWFGSDPGHEALSAFGLLQFDDMAQVMAVDTEMVVRTRTWLMDRRDGKGSFKRNPRSLHSWSVEQEVVDAYVLWALTESDVASGNPQRSATELLKELNRLNDKARVSKNSYLVSLAAASMMNVKREIDGEFLLKRLVDMQQEDGHLAGSTTVTHSGGLSKKVETTALAMLAWSKSDRHNGSIRSAAKWLVKNRSGNGGFASTQGTVLALKALVAYSKIASPEMAGVVLYVKKNNEVIGEAQLPDDPKNGSTVEIIGLGSKLHAGENEIELVAERVKGLPFSVEILYHAMTLPSDDRCPLELTTEFVGVEKVDTDSGTTQKPVASGATVQVKAQLTNKSDVGQPMTLATIGLPGGVEPRVEQLNELRDAGMFDYYEIRPREVICYWRTLAPRETKNIEFDVTAEIAGKYTGPASRAYLYYTAEQKVWTQPLKIEINK